MFQSACRNSALGLLTVSFLHGLMCMHGAGGGAGTSSYPRRDPTHSLKAHEEGQSELSQPKLDGAGPLQHGVPEADGAAGHVQPGGFQDSEWQGDEPINRRYLAADILHDEDDDMDEDAIPGTP